MNKHWLRTGRIKRRSTTMHRLLSALCRAKETGCGLLVLSVLVSADVVSTPVQSGAAGAAHQSVAGAPNNPTEKQLASDRQRALQMLDPLFEATSKLAPDLTKIYLQTRIADALWEYDEPRARSRFETALTTCESLKVDVPSADSRSQYRGDVLEAIKQRDPYWAKKLALDNWHSTKKQEPDMWTLLLLIDVDTQLAIQILRREIESNATSWLERDLTRLRAKDVAQADELFTYALLAAARRSKRSSETFRELFNYVFPSKTENYLGFDLGSDKSPARPELITRFLAFGCEALIREANQIEQESGKHNEVGERSGMGYMEVQLWLPFFDRYAADCATKIRTRWDAAILSLRGGKEHIRQTKLMFGPMSKEDALRDAKETKDPMERMALYMRAINLAADEGNFDEALSLLKTTAEAKVSSDLEVRILVKAAKSAIAVDDADAAYRYTKNLHDLRTRTELSSDIARMLHKRKDSLRAVNVLNEALEYARKAGDNWQRPYAMLQLANAATLLEPERGFEVVNQAIEGLNNAKSFVQVFDFDNNLELLARLNLDRALSLAEKLSDNENRLKARIAICRGVLCKQ